MARIQRSDRRIEDVRRRTTQPRKAVPPAVRRLSRGGDYAPPPVMARSGSRVMPAREAKRGQPHNWRRFDVALNVPGAEMRLPSLPHLQIGWRIFSAVMAAGLAFLLYSLWNSTIFRVSAAEVSGLQRLNGQDVNAVLGVDDQPVFLLDPKIMEQELLDAFPEFTAVTATVNLPATVLVTVTERAPVLAWRQDGRTTLVDAQGMAFPVRDPMEEQNLPVVESQVPPPLLQPAAKSNPQEDLAALEQPEGEMPVKEDFRGAKQLLAQEMVAAVLALVERAPQNTAIFYDPIHGLGWKDGHGWDAFFGDWRDMDMKLRVYKALVKRLSSDDGQPTFISVEFVHAPYYRLER